MKNVLFLSSWYPSRVHTTLGNFVRYHALAASKYNTINVLYIVADDNVKDYEIKYFQDEELKTTIVYFKRGFFKYLNYFIAFTKGFQFLLKKKKIKFDIVHMNIMHPGIWQALYLKWIYKIPYIVSENWHGFQDLAKYNLSFLEMMLIKLGFRFSSVISPVSQQLKNCMINANYIAEYKIIPNVVDTDKFHIGELDTNKNNFTFLHVSTLDDSIKNVSGILDAFEKIYHLRKSLNEWEEKVGIKKFNKNSRIILTAIHTLQKLPISIDELKNLKFIKNSMSNATFNRSINELLSAKKIVLFSNPKDRRSQLIDKI